MAHDEDNLARLTSVRTEMEAGVIVGGLEERGIQATMSGVYTANFRAEAPGWVEVLVAEQDLPQRSSRSRRSRAASAATSIGRKSMWASRKTIGIGRVRDGWASFLAARRLSADHDWSGV